MVTVAIISAILCAALLVSRMFAVYSYLDDALGEIEELKKIIKENDKSNKKHCSGSRQQHA